MVDKVTNTISSMPDDFQLGGVQVGRLACPKESSTSLEVTTVDFCTSWVTLYPQLTVWIHTKELNAPRLPRDTLIHGKLIQGDLR